MYEEASEAKNIKEPFSSSAIPILCIGFFLHNSLYKLGCSLIISFGGKAPGLIQLTRWLAAVIAPDVRVNTISPGGVWRNQPSKFVKRYESRTPLKRMATEEDFKGIVAYLASDLSSYVTGQNILVDGGWSVW